MSSATDLAAVAMGANNTASGVASHAEGYKASATGQYGHAEGQMTTASSDASHAEGYYTEASGMYSHAEGIGTITSNPGEHAQGILNDSPENQIFSVGAGYGDPSDPSTVTRRNAISVLAVDNGDSLAGSFFVQNIGGYNGTNPIPGTNDLATVINGMSTGGGTATSTETWTFTLDNGSTVTKNIVIA